MLHLRRGFHTNSFLCFPLSNHKLYPKVDWEKIEAGQYAVVDPVNPGQILYLSEQDYVVMVRVAITSNRTLKVLATPGETPEPASTDSTTSNSKNSPQGTIEVSWLNDLFPEIHSWARRQKKRIRFLFHSTLTPFTVKVMGQGESPDLFEGVSMVKLTPRNICQWFHKWHDVLSWWSRGSQLATVSRDERTSFGIYLRKILSRHGINHLIARLKIMLFVVNAYLGGRKLTSTQGLGFRVRLSNGLPRCLPLNVRRGIRFGNKHYIHIWTSVLFAYKGILGTWEEPELAKSPITQAHPNLENSTEFNGFKDFVSVFWNNLYMAGMPSFSPKIRTPFFTTKAGPNSPVAILGAGFDAYLWCAMDHFNRLKPSSEDVGIMTRPNESSFARLVYETCGVERNYIREWLESTGQSDLARKFRETAKAFALNHQLHSFVTDLNTIHIKSPNKKTSIKWRPFQWIADLFGDHNTLIRFKTPSLSRLHNLYEAAGKVRTIAIVDYWTNYCLKPVHDWMFKVLTLLPQDATFDQEGKVEDFAKRGYEFIYSYDLKSATDLIPLALYRALFRAVMPEKIVELWLDILVKRSFLVPKETLKKFPAHPRRIFYGTGQPMGALTSWASMALVHHALVLYAALTAGVITPSRLLLFRDYLVLGDDIVIAEVLTAKRYVQIMADLSIPIGLAKSHSSVKGMFNFANQTFVSERNVSPISMREDINANSLPTRLELILRMARRGWFDLTSRAWVNSFIKKVFTPRFWTESVQPLVAHRRTSPIIQWVIGVLLTPGTTRFGFTGIKNIDLQTFLGGILRKGGLWSTRVVDLHKFLCRQRTDALLLSILGKWVDGIYRNYLENRNRFLGFDNWVCQYVDIEWLFRDIFENSRKVAFEKWALKYRKPLKTIQVTSRITGIRDRETFSHVVDIPWEDLVPLVQQADAELPIVPDFTFDVHTILKGTDDGGSARVRRHYSQQLQSFLRITKILNMIDHLGPSGTPGFVKPGITSQSTASSKEVVQK